MARFGVVLSVALTLVAPAWTQNPSLNSQRSALAASPLTGGTIVSDAILNGSAVWISGSDRDTGQATLKARQNGQSRLDLALSNGPRSEIRIHDALNGRYQTLAAGKWSTHAIHNDWVDANWFFPALSALTVGSQNGFSVGPISDAWHLYAQFQIANQKPKITSQVQSLSTVLYDLDPATSLPTALHFFTHPDEDLGTNIRVDVQFSDYRVVNGVEVPFRIRRYVNGTLQLDITVSSAIINPGLSDSDFTAN